jgi:CRISPR-associated endonuclease/helicase Cas3
VIEEIKIRLKNGPRVLLVSTSVIECGVDLDFPRAMRAIGPLERIIQAAGRCNREGLRSREESEVVVFTPDDGASPKGFYHMAMQRTMRLLYKGQEEVDLDDPVFVTAYFRDLYEAFALDRKQIGGRIQEDRRAFRYDDVAEKMQLIEQDTVGVFVTDYQPEEAQAILQEMYKRGRMTRDLWQRAQPFCVALPHYEAFCPQAPVEEIVSGLLVWRGKYDLKTGIPLDRGIADLTYVPSALIAP